MTVVAVLVFAVALGFVLKGVSGFAEAIPLAALGPLVLPVPEVIAIITIIDLAAGMVVLPSARVPLLVLSDWRRYLALVVGTVVGVWVLKIASPNHVRIGVAVVLLGTAVWVLRSAFSHLGYGFTQRFRPGGSSVNGGKSANRSTTQDDADKSEPGGKVVGGVLGPSDVVPDDGHAAASPRPGSPLEPMTGADLDASGPANSVGRFVGPRQISGCAVAGLTGGVSGLDGPPLFAALSSPGSDVKAVRDDVMRLLLASALLRLILLAVTGQLIVTSLLLALSLVPVAAVAFLVGRRTSMAWGASSVAVTSAAVCVAGVLLALFS